MHAILYRNYVQDYDGLKYKEYIVGRHITPSVWHLQKQLLYQNLRTATKLFLILYHTILMASSNKSLKYNSNTAAAQCTILEWYQWDSNIYQLYRPYCLKKLEQNKNTHKILSFQYYWHSCRSSCTQGLQLTSYMHVQSLSHIRAT